MLKVPFYSNHITESCFQKTSGKGNGKNIEIRIVDNIDDALKYQHIPDWYEKSLLENNEGTYFPEHIENAGKASYVERNQEMINHSKYCVVYYDENYLPQKRRNSKRDLFDYQPKSGTAVAYDYAVKKKTEIINVAL